MLDNLLKSQAFKVKGRLYTLTVLQVLHANPILFGDYLVEVTSKAPKLFENTPMVLDFSSIQNEPIDLQGFCQQLREHHIHLVAIQGGDSHLQTMALANGLALIGGSSSQDKVLVQDIPTAIEPSAINNKTKLITTPVRSGQQVVSKGGDLIIVASVSHGAELLADGNIHVYGALRGRALAGIDGNKQARIFCQSLDAELVSIAGFYRLRDSIAPPEGPCQLFLQDDLIQIAPL